MLGYLDHSYLDKGMYLIDFAENSAEEDLESIVEYMEVCILVNFVMKDLKERKRRDSEMHYCN